MSSTVRLVWKCLPPKTPHLKQLCEKIMTDAAISNKMDTAIIRWGRALMWPYTIWLYNRKEAHNTTRVNGRYVRTVPHITGDIINSTFREPAEIPEENSADLPTGKDQTGYALHYNADSNHTQALPDLPQAPNPEMWPLKFKAGKGFIHVCGL